MRRVFDQVNETSDRVFLFNMPATWQTPASFAMYRQELERLGRFLMKWGGTLPQSTPLARAMEFYQAQRQKLRDQQPHLQNLAFFKRVQQFYQSGLVQDLDASAAVPNNGIRLALVGCPLLETHERIHAYLDEHGGRVVLDATSSGERSWPTEFNPDNLASDPALELARAYFYGISDVFRRPNTPLYDYLKEQCRSRQVQGILFWHYPWCDLWLAEVERMKTELVLPLIVLDGAVDDSALPRLTNRIGAFLEMLS
jgi:benzoyl-CoA reductase/2-hydroxyglutaryl-CoA dehydratase subunit BcrC/BadD/HgdB